MPDVNQKGEKAPSEKQKREGKLDSNSTVARLTVFYH